MKEKDEQQRRMVAGKLYNSSDTCLILLRTLTRSRVDRYNRTRAWQIVTRTRLIKKLFPNGGKSPFFEPPVRTEYGENVTFGDNFYMNFGCMLLDVAPIKIGNNVMFGPNVIVATPCHPLVAQERIMHNYDDGFHCWEYAKPIEIGDNVWIASSVTVCGGVKIGSNSVIAAGSVVVRDIPEGVLAGGVPAKVIRPITDEDRMFAAQNIAPPTGE